MMNRAKRLLENLPPWLLSALTACAIMWLTLSPRPLGDIEPELFPGADKLAHAVMFGGITLTLLLDRMRSYGWQRPSGRFVAGCWLAATLFGVLIEVAQKFSGFGRSFEINDIIADSAGALAVAAFWFIFVRSQDNRSAS